MKSRYSALLLCFLTVQLTAQTLEFAQTTTASGEEVPYLFLSESLSPKPVLLFIMGSMPSPPLVIDAKGDTVSSLPFDYTQYTDRFQVVVVSKQCIPLVVSYKKLDKRNVFVDPETKFIPECFLQGNAASDEVDRHLAVIRALQGKSSVQPNKILVVGHSAGARIATQVAAASTAVSHLAYLSSEPRGRYYEIMQRAATQSTSDTLALTKVLTEWQNTVDNRENRDAKYGDSYRTTFSHSTDMIPVLLGLKQPIYAAWGANDTKAAGMMAIPYEFIRAGKTNLTYRIFPEMEHNFFRTNESGGIDVEHYFFPAVFDTIVNWFLN